MKKLFAILTLLMFAISLLSGCGSQTAKKDDISEEVELIWYTPLFTEAPDMPMVLEKVNEYLKPKINAKLKIVHMNGDDYDKKINIMATSGEPFDILFTCFWAAPFIQSVANNQLAPLDDLLKDYAPELMKEEIPELWKAATVGGKIYAIPDNGAIAGQQTFTFNKALASKYSLDYNSIHSFNDLYTAFQKIHAVAPKQVCMTLNSFFYPADRFDCIRDYMTPGAVIIGDSSCKVINQFEDPKFLECLHIYREMYKNGMIPYVPKDQASTISTRLYRSGQAITEVNDYNGMGPLALDPMYTRNYGFPTISIPADQKPIKTTRSATGNMLAISATSKHPERAMMFLNLLSTDKYLNNLITYGIEGIHYTKIGENKIKLTARHKDYDISAPFTGNMFLKYLQENDPDNLIESIKKYNESAITSPIYGFCFNPDSVKTEIAALKNISDEFNDQLFNGSMDVEPTLKKYLAKLNAAGMQKVLVEMQKQVDEWKKSQK